MKKINLVAACLAILFLATFSPAAEKVAFGTAVKLFPPYYLPMLAAQEKGLWKEQGLEGEWVDFTGGGPFMQALAAKAIKAGYTAAPTTYQVAARGLPVIIVSDHYRMSLIIWVSGTSRLKEPKDIKGAKIGISSLGSTPHVMGRVAAKRLGLEKEVRFVGVGGHASRLAALKTGAIDGFISSFISVAELSLKGELRELINTGEYVPKEWTDNVMVSHKAFVQQEPALIGRIVKTSLKAIAFVTGNQAWTIEKMKSLSGYSEATAKAVHEDMRIYFTKDGRISTKALENVAAFMVDYGLLAREKAPRPEDVYTDAFLK